MCLSTGMQACADSTLNEFTFENVTTALSASAETFAAGYRVLSSLAIEGHLSH